MDLSQPPASEGLTESDISLLKKGGFQTLADLLVWTPEEIARKCKASPLEVRRMVETALSHIPLLQPTRLDVLLTQPPEIFTTGEVALDKALRGGIYTEHLYEIVGESAAGKTQLALQLSLFVQLPVDQGGLSGAACYITTSSVLPTTRLKQILDARPELNEDACDLGHIHTLSTPDVLSLQQTLTHNLPRFIEGQEVNPETRPIKLVVIDAIAELFRSKDMTRSALFERSRELAAISTTLHQLMSTYRLAFVVLNEVMDAFDQERTFDMGGNSTAYSNQARWFGSCDMPWGGTRKEASLGLVWANQVNTRIMLSRTGRRRFPDEDDGSLKRRRIDTPSIEAGPPQLARLQEDGQPVLIRSLSILFSSLCSPASFDYLISESGFSILQETTEVSDREKQPSPHIQLPPPPVRSQLQPPSTAVIPSSLPNEEEFERYWKRDPLDDFDWDELELQLSQQVS